MTPTILGVPRLILLDRPGRCACGEATYIGAVTLTLEGNTFRCLLCQLREGS